MSKLIENLEQLFTEKNIPIDKVELDSNFTLYQLYQHITEKHFTKLEIIVPKTDIGDIQVCYRYVGQLADYNKKAEMLEFVNDLNELQTGYYTLFLAGDGELYLRLLSRVNSNLEQFYEMLITGLQTAKDIALRLEMITGRFSNL